MLDINKTIRRAMAKATIMARHGAVIWEDYDGSLPLPGETITRAVGPCESFEVPKAEFIHLRAERMARYVNEIPVASLQNAQVLSSLIDTDVIPKMAFGITSEFLKRIPLMLDKSQKSVANTENVTIASIRKEIEAQIDKLDLQHRHTACWVMDEATFENLRNLRNGNRDAFSTLWLDTPLLEGIPVEVDNDADGLILVSMGNVGIGIANTHEDALVFNVNAEKTSATLTAVFVGDAKIRFPTAGVALSGTATAWKIDQ